MFWAHFQSYPSFDSSSCSFSCAVRADLVRKCRCGAFQFSPKTPVYGTFLCHNYRLCAQRWGINHKKIICRDHPFMLVRPFYAYQRTRALLCLLGHFMLISWRVAPIEKTVKDIEVIQDDYSCMFRSFKVYSFIHFACTSPMFLVRHSLQAIKDWVTSCE